MSLFFCILCFQKNGFYHIRGWVQLSRTQGRGAELPILPFCSSSKISRLGGFLNFTEKISRPHEAIAINLPQCCCLYEASTIKLPELLLNNEATSKRLTQLISIWLFLSQHQESFLFLLVITLFWFLTHQDWFLKRA